MDLPSTRTTGNFGRRSRHEQLGVRGAVVAVQAAFSIGSRSWVARAQHQPRGAAGKIPGLSAWSGMTPSSTPKKLECEASVSVPSAGKGPTPAQPAFQAAS